MKNTIEKYLLVMFLILVSHILFSNLGFDLISNLSLLTMFPVLFLAIYNPRDDIIYNGFF